MRFVLLYQGAVQIQDVCKSYRPEESLHQHPACHAAIATSLWQHQIRGNRFGICTFYVSEICHFSAGFNINFVIAAFPLAFVKSLFFHAINSLVVKNKFARLFTMLMWCFRFCWKESSMRRMGGLMTSPCLSCP